ncbi:conserved hypothetical protein [Vibrio chagasii]|nr:conserved hypothetical protein [Vibrio chagasii]CAH7093862.1 conserved hypothetical protein [Vibrio chagasii]CAH7156902.1 conserved hypothetical protein [Vibrio chagasii]CAH7175686.1 conserved hypothetical protein [Vibrio chagasii]CAH7286539.1 conserved hypothetical protein [Vibrio chagasii]
MFSLSKTLKLGLLLFVLLVGFLLVFLKPLSLFTPNTISEPSSNIVDEPESLILSVDSGFPTPVIQLQQTIAHGLREAERSDLPLLSGELSEFSQSNIKEAYPQSPELNNLKLRLETLQSITTPK